MRSCQFFTHFYFGLNIVLLWTYSNSDLPFFLFLSRSLISLLSLSTSDPSTPRVPKPVNQQIVNEGPSSKTHTVRERTRESESGRRAERQGGVLDQLSVCQNMSTRLSLCLLSLLMWVPQWASRKDHNTALALWVSLSCSIKCEQVGDRETAREGEKEINYMFQ